MYSTPPKYLRSLTANAPEKFKMKGLEDDPASDWEPVTFHGGEL